MPAGTFTIIDALQQNLVLGGIVQEYSKAVPEVGAFPFRPYTQGIKFQSLFMVEPPTTGFRKLGDGIAASKGRYEMREFKMFLHSGRVEVEKAAAAADSEGLSGVEARQTRDFMLGAMVTLGAQIFEGVNAGADGFPGLRAFAPFGGAYTYNAGGTTSSTGSSVYGVKFGDDYASLIGQDGQGGEDPMRLGDFRDADITGNNGKAVPGRVADLEGWIGLAIKHKASVVRITNLTADSGKGLTDSLAGAALDLLPIGIRPDVWFMAKRSRTQLRNSRITNEVKAPPRPTELEGIPIIVTDSIGIADAIEA